MGGNLTGGFWWRESINPNYGHAYRVELVFEEKKLQKVQILKNPYWGYFLVLDGIVQFTEKDEFIYHETITLLPASLLPFLPEEVLIIGGGDGGVLRELQKIPSIKKIIQFEIDLTVYELCQKYFSKISGDFSDPRLNFQIKDGLKGLQEVSSEVFDLIIVDCTDPIGPAKSLYTYEFYSLAYQALKAYGVFIQQASLPAYFPNILNTAYFLAKKVFPVVKVARTFVPSYGEEIAFLVATKEEKDWFHPKQLFSGQYYYPALNFYYFTLPKSWLSLMGEDKRLTCK
ncbi:MAG: spermine synthase [Caldimicrobium sp.]|nr:spermine synthase [Caldimicrobium sp.]